MNTSSEKDIVSTALSNLSQTLDGEKERLNEVAAQAMKDGEYDTATAVIQFTKRLLGFQAEVEALIGKWEELDDIGNLATQQVGHVVHTRVVQSKPPGRLPRTKRPSYKGITESTVHCFHILDILEEMGGAAKNQDVSAGVNERIKMLYQTFKEARILMAQKGWTKTTGRTTPWKYPREELSGCRSRRLNSQTTVTVITSPRVHRLNMCPIHPREKRRNTKPKDSWQRYPAIRISIKSENPPNTAQSTQTSVLF
jgi:hypothetical protein